MSHSNGGPATDKFDMVTALVDWVERGVAPDRIVASVRGKNAAAPNPEIPANWSPDRTRPLCPYPAVAQYIGSGDLEDAVSFECRGP
jgi:hypothetical protein